MVGIDVHRRRSVWCGVPGWSSSVAAVRASGSGPAWQPEDGPAAAGAAVRRSTGYCRRDPGDTARRRHPHQLPAHARSRARRRGAAARRRGGISCSHWRTIDDALRWAPNASLPGCAHGANGPFDRRRIKVTRGLTSRIVPAPVVRRRCARQLRPAGRRSVAGSGRRRPSRAAVAGPGGHPRPPWSGSYCVTAHVGSVRFTRRRQRRDRPGQRPRQLTCRHRDDPERSEAMSCGRERHDADRGASLRAGSVRGGRGTRRPRHHRQIGQRPTSLTNVVVHGVVRGPPDDHRATPPGPDRCRALRLTYQDPRSVSPDWRAGCTSSAQGSWPAPC